MLRHCLEGIQSPEAQAHATVFVAKFFGRAALMSFLSSVHTHQRPALFRSLLYEAVGRTINPVNGAVGLLWAGNWHLCQLGVDKVLRGGALTPLPRFSSGSSVPAPEGFGSVLDDAGSGTRRLKRKVGGGDDVVVAENFQADDDREGFLLGRSDSPEKLVVGVGGRIYRAKDDRRSATPSEESETSTLGSSAGHGGSNERKLLRLFF
ncbi:LOB domain-containing protein 37-like [Senna tora]|uniref:LOB domain-containing protein 37-like n=1 Tax=Senna tora TaxID=362788 RepID=A0A834XBZ8_9FABA|nr:LOB domain-containing protein 37-like [Senna tora]